MPAGHGRAAAFETRIWWSPGSAAKAILGKLEGHGYAPAGPAQRFVVQELVDIGPVHDEQSDGGCGQGDDAVAEGQSVAAVAQLPGHEIVPRQHRGEHREPVVCRVRGQDEDEGCRPLHEVEGRAVGRRRLAAE